METVRIVHPEAGEAHVAESAVEQMRTAGWRPAGEQGASPPLGRSPAELVEEPIAELVTIVHPEAGEAQVPESAVPHWRSSGWDVAEEQPAEKPAGKPAKQETPRRRRESKGDE
jgi:hypothetical protein